MNDQTYELIFILSGMFWVGVLLISYWTYRLSRWLFNKYKGESK